MTTLQDVARLRLAAQRIAGPGFVTATEAVRWLTALQAQDYPGALASVMLRTDTDTDTDGPGAGGIRAALDAGEVVRSWPMRGTLHLVAAEDLGWMLALTTDRLLAGAARRRAQLGIDEAMIARAGELAHGVLAGGRSATRAELMGVWDDAGLLGVKQRGYHLLWHLSQRGLTCFGPTDGNEQRIVLLDEWVPAPRRLEREEALAEWVLRYFRGHGPATRKDFMWWTKLTAKDTSAGLAVAREQLEAIEVDGVEHLMDPSTSQRLAEIRDAARGVHLLPGFDEFLLGYQDRRASLPPDFADRVVPGGNGMFRATVVADGTVVGTWRRTGKGARRGVEGEPFTSFTPAVRRALPHLAESYPEPTTAARAAAGARATAAAP
ncbi:winged helix DNA-binding domain-containing protein [Georgenia yuyongxinii]|uniref:Winged helix DNA-binding domain-containing protein n=1 Tax=Georgenia yuyongxinii TaxID=2589797 RepID=A0A5B8C1Z0_9MICO|nr:winged helix DNA-binding domain-containing protein [Georgenia yuyongxinii]QDC23272.1 winged helix DNA-binding domain-containing protein [Georgenia yuyongxinii]